MSRNPAERSRSTDREGLDKVLSYLKSKHFLVLAVLLGGSTGTLGWQHWANLAENTALIAERFKSGELRAEVRELTEATQGMRAAMDGVQEKQDMALERLEELRKQPCFNLKGYTEWPWSSGDFLILTEPAATERP